MSRSKEYQRLLNDKRWKQLRIQYLQAHPLCEICAQDGYVRAAIDCHHKTPVESAKSRQEMERLCYDWNNLQALCIPCHVRVHKEQRSHSRKAHQQREQDRIKQWMSKHLPRKEGDQPKC